MVTQLEIDGHNIGPNNKTFIIAELSANHLHDLDIALEILEEAYKAGVDAFKIQTLKPQTMTIECDNKYFTINSGSPWDGKTFYELYSETPLPYDWHKDLFEKARELGLTIFSTPYDKSAVDFLDKFDPPAYKVASFEITDIPLIEYIAKRGKPVIISTGIATKQEIREAVNACRRFDNNDIILLKCTSAYPTPPEEMNLNMITKLKEDFNVLTGLSDHSRGKEAAIASVSLGACVIEKHMTLSRSLGGPDASFSIEPNEFSDLVDSVRKVESALGDSSYQLTESAKENRVFSRSLFTVKDLKKGERFNEENIRSIRPGYGLKPKFYNKILDKGIAAKNIKRGTPLDWDMIENIQKP